MSLETLLNIRRRSTAQNRLQQADITMSYQHSASQLDAELSSLLFSPFVTWLPPSSRGPGHIPFTDATRVRIPLGVLNSTVRSLEVAFGAALNSL